MNQNKIMKCSSDMLDQINETLEICREFIERKQIVKLNSTFSKFTSSYNKMFSTLSSEKIMNIDPYGGEHDLQNLEIPDQNEVPYNEEEYTISIRLTHYQSLLNHIKDNKIISLEYLQPDNFKKIEQIINFIDWDRIFDPQPLEINTEALNKVLFEYQKEHEQKYTIASLKASTKDITNYSLEFIEEMKSVKLYINEKYKLYIRTEILDHIKLPPKLKGENIKKAHDLITIKLKQQGIPVYIELIGEILKEDFSEDGESIKKEIIDQLENIDPLNIVKRSVKKKVEKQDPIELLKNATLELTKITTQMETLTSKLKDNSDSYIDENYSFIQKIINYVKYNFMGQKKVTIFDLELKAKDNEKSQYKSVEFEKFLTTVGQLEKILIGYKNSESITSQDLFERDEDEIKGAVHQLLSKSRYIYKILIAFNNYFKSNLNSYKGIAIELKVYLSVLDKSQEHYYEYNKLKSETQDNATYKPDTNQEP